MSQDYRIVFMLKQGGGGGLGPKDNNITWWGGSTLLVGLTVKYLFLCFPLFTLCKKRAWQPDPPTPPNPTPLLFLKTFEILHSAFSQGVFFIVFDNNNNNNNNKKPERQNRVDRVGRWRYSHVLLGSHLARDCTVTVYIPGSYQWQR